MFFLAAEFKKWKKPWIRAGRGYMNHANVEHLLNDIEIKPLEDYILYNDLKSNDYEKEWQNIRQRYKRICLQKVRVAAIGEMVMAYCNMQAHNRDKDTLYVALPVLDYPYKRVANEAVLKYIGIADSEEVLFWLYVIDRHKDEIDLSEINKYVYRGAYPTYPVKAGSIESHFTEEQIEYGENYLKKIGVSKPYVCMASRGAYYNQTTMPGYKEDQYSHRNASFYDYEKTIRYLAQNGIMTVKAGRNEEPIRPIEKCVDYAGVYGDPFIDMYLVAKSEFLITGPTGVFALANLFAKPMLMVNFVPYTYGMGGMRFTEYDLVLPKRYIRKRDNHQMSFMEILEHEKKIGIYTKDYDKAGIELINNTEDEILEATRELMARLNGTWTDKKEDVENYKQYVKIYDIMKNVQCNNPKNWQSEPTPLRPAATFLRKYPYLLGEKR